MLWLKGWNKKNSPPKYDPTSNRNNSGTVCPIYLKINVRWVPNSDPTHIKFQVILTNSSWVIAVGSWVIFGWTVFFLFHPLCYDLCCVMVMLCYVMSGNWPPDWLPWSSWTWLSSLPGRSNLKHASEYHRDHCTGSCNLSPPQKLIVIQACNKCNKCNMA